MMAGSGQSGHGAGRGPAGALLQGQPTADACGADDLNAFAIFMRNWRGGWLQ